MSKLERDLYLASRMTGDVHAARNGTLPRRIVARHYHRWLLQKARKSSLWTLR